MKLSLKICTFLYLFKRIYMYMYIHVVFFSQWVKINLRDNSHYYSLGTNHVCKIDVIAIENMIFYYILLWYEYEPVVICKN